MPELEPGDEQQDYYHILGVAEEASDDEIRHRYYTLAKKWHPDRFINAAEKERLLAERRMKQLTRAYGVLGNAQLRLEYGERRTPSPVLDDDGHVWHPMPGMYSSSIVPPGFAAPAPSTIEHEDKNGTGLFFALLAFLLGLGCLGLLLNRSPDIITGSFLLVGMIIFTLAGLLFLQQESPLNRLVNTWMESEPKEFRQARQASAHTRALDDDRPDEALSAFEVLVEEALESIPEEFQEQMQNISVLVEQEPAEETLERVGVKEGHILLGLYQGVPLTKQGIAGGGMEHITIFQQAIETYCHGDPDRIRDQVRRTVLHEMAHHFGIDHDEMPIWVK